MVLPVAYMQMNVNNIVEAPCYVLQRIGELIVSKYVAELINN